MPSKNTMKIEYLTFQDTFRHGGQLHFKVLKFIRTEEDWEEVRQILANTCEDKDYYMNGVYSTNTLSFGKCAKGVGIRTLKKLFKDHCGKSYKTGEFQIINNTVVIRFLCVKVRNAGTKVLEEI